MSVAGINSAKEKIRERVLLAREKCEAVLNSLEELKNENFSEATRNEALLRAFVCERFYSHAVQAEDLLAAGSTGLYIPYSLLIIYTVLSTNTIYRTLS